MLLPAYIPAKMPSPRALAALLLAGVLAGALPGQPAATQTEGAPDYLSFATEDEANSTEIFSKASPAVVYVTTSSLRRNRFSLSMMEVPRGSGSGFVWHDSGLVVTNFHVIAGADRVQITLHDSSSHAAEIIGVAPEKDLAVLRLLEPPEGLATLPLGDSTELSVGRKVLAIGNPFGLDTTRPPAWSAPWGGRSARRAAGKFAGSSRPTPPSIRAIPAAPCSTPSANWWG